MNIRNFTPRPYQESILNTCIHKNTLVCLPTGLGKTKVAILLAIERIKKYPDTKAIILTPTRPLANQICNEFKECTTVDEDKIILLTGAISPSKREKIYENAVIIIATPQTIQEDIENNRINLQKFSALIVDEAHRSRENYANTIVARHYKNLVPFGRIIALTASPGSTKAKIDEICTNLSIESVEIRTETDEDVAKFVQNKDITYIHVELPEKIREIHKLMKDLYLEKIGSIKTFIPYKPQSMINKLDLLNLQKYLQREIQNKNQAAFYGMSLVAQLLKLSHAIEMLETQGLSSFNEFLKKLETETTKASKSILSSSNTIKARSLTNILLSEGIEHPKILKLKEITKTTLEEKKESKIIIFTTYRNTVEIIVNLLNSEGIKTIKLVGQKEGLSQKEQIKAIEDFNSGLYSCLVTTSIGEEGIHIGEADMAIFYDNTPSSIRKIQRTGRVGRLKSGKVIFMITKNTRDAAYHYKSRRDEKTMKEILYKMKEKNKVDDQKSLNQF
ncbi:MAG TPA: DEAD/DEAH box helicase [Candidatus Nanoarchaeia archaeon]|nr:DEAD/DEAH box helicase [Candidatus Nanoarchaeia archaeon]